MKLGLFTSGYQRNPLEHCFEDAKRFGYDFVELWGGRPHAYAYDLEKGEIEEVKRLIKKYDMPVLGYVPEHNGYPYNFMIGSELQWEDTMDYLKTCLRMTKEMGAEYMMISPAHAGYLTTYDKMWERLEKSVRVLVEEAEKLEIMLVIETLTPFESNVFKSANDVVHLFNNIKSDYLVGMCDVVPPFVQHESITAYIDKLGDKMYHLHIIDGELATDSHIMPGEGDIPLPELFKELKYMGYDKTATIELVTNYINEPRLYARRAIERVREYMEEAGY